VGAPGPHDDFEDAKKVIRAAYAEFNLNQDLEAIREKYIADDLEYVNRYGTFNGPERYLSDLRTQADRWNLQTEVEEILDAGGGALVVLTKFSRIDADSGEVEWKAWPAAVMRVNGGKMVFFEGYVDRRDAFSDYGLERG
jgi:hypothetical protein